MRATAASSSARILASSSANLACSAAFSESSRADDSSTGRVNSAGVSSSASPSVSRSESSKKPSESTSPRGDVAASFGGAPNNSSRARVNSGSSCSNAGVPSGVDENSSDFGVAARATISSARAVFASTSASSLAVASEPSSTTSSTTEVSSTGAARFLNMLAMLVNAST